MRGAHSTARAEEHLCSRRCIVGVLGPMSLGVGECSVVVNHCKPLWAAALLTPPPLAPWMHKVCFGKAAEGPFLTYNFTRLQEFKEVERRAWPTLEEVSAQQGCSGQLSCVSPARLHQLLWSQDSNHDQTWSPFQTFPSPHLLAASDANSVAVMWRPGWLAGLLSSCPHSILLPGGPGWMRALQRSRRECAGYPGYSAVTLPLQVTAVVDLDRGQALPITQATQMRPSTTQRCKICLAEAVHPALH